MTASKTKDLQAANGKPVPAIAVEKIVKKYGDFEAVKGVDFEVAEGEIFGLLGPNGAGKSTLIRMMTTLIPVTAGRALVAGHDVSKEANVVRHMIGVIPQALTSDQDLTVEENLIIYAKLYSVPKVQRDKSIAEVLEAVDLTKWRGAQTKTLSGGMRRRLEIARGLVHNPRIFFLDEPTTGLDPQSRSALWTEVGRLARDEGVTVFLTTQYLEEADVLADRVGIIDHGHIVAEGTPAELKAEVGRPTVEAIPAERADEERLGGVLARFGEPCGSTNGVAVRLGGQADLAAVVRALDAEEIRVENIALHQPSLDDVFLAKTGRSLEGSEEEEEETRSAGLAMEPA